MRWPSCTTVGASIVTLRLGTSSSVRMAQSDWVSLAVCPVRITVYHLVCGCLSNSNGVLDCNCCHWTSDSLVLHSLHLSSLSLFLSLSSLLSPLADFGVSAITTKNKQKRDTFIGTPYWYDIPSGMPWCNPGLVGTLIWLLAMK